MKLSFKQCTVIQAITVLVFIFSTFLPGQGLAADAADTHSEASITCDIQHLIVQEAIAHGRIPVTLALAIGKVGSNYDVSLRSSDETIGLMRVHTTKAETELGIDEAALLDPKLNIRASLQILNRLYYIHSENWDAALFEYFNTGDADQHGEVAAHNATNEYVKGVYSWWSRYDRVPHYWDPKMTTRFGFKETSKPNQQSREKTRFGNCTEVQGHELYRCEVELDQNYTSSTKRGLRFR